MAKRQITQLWMERALSVALLFMLSTAYMLAQKVKGIVRDASGETLVGVNILEKGTHNGTVTRADGSYEINVQKGKTLTFSYIGYESKDVVVKSEKLNVYLKEDSKLLNDMVVVGYGSMRRKDLTSSVTTVKAEDLNKGVFTDPAQMLQGKVPGLVVTSNGDPNGTPSITLRGASTLRTGDAVQPYYVIDGIPGVDISMVAPDDIESIDVLRDATATAIYGSKAANGVIIITTKSGKNGKTNVSYNGYVGFDQVSNKLDMMDADGLRSLSQYGINVDDNGGNVDWQKQILRTGVSYNHNLSINGGNDKTKYSASVSYMNRQGVITGTNFSRLNVRTLLTTKILKDHLELSAGANLVYGKHQGVAMNWHGESVIDAMNYYSPLNPIYNADGSYFRVTDQPDKNYNPLSMIKEDTEDNNMKRQQFMGKATLHIIKGLDWNVNYAFNNYQRTGSTYHSSNSQVVSYKLEGEAYRNTSFGHDNKFETFGNYEVSWNDVNKLTAMLGYSWEETVYGDGFGQYTTTFYNDDLKWNGYNAANVLNNNITGLTNDDKEVIRNISFYGRVNYSYNSRYMIQATLRRDGSSSFGANHQWGTFPSVSAAWNITEEKFMKNQDVLSNLKLRVGYGESGNAMGFGAYSARALYSVSHNSTPFTYNRYGETKTYYPMNAYQNENQNLKWETTGMFNVGLDFAFLGGRINGTIEFYNKKTRDLIWNYSVMAGDINYAGQTLSDGSYPAYTVSNINYNVGDMTNRGIEFTINADVVKTKDFRWNSSLNLSHNMNRVDKISNSAFSVDEIYEGDPDVAGVSANGYTQRISEGYALGTFYLYEFAGFENGRPVYYEHDEKTGERTGNKITDSELSTTRDRVVAGSALPKLTLGWNNTLTWKNWNATLFFTGQFGNKIYNGTRASNLATSRLTGASGTKNVLSDYINEMVVDGKAVTDTNVPSDRWLENGSYFRLQTLTIGYTFSNCFDGWIKDIQLYGTVNNVFTITGYKGIDPELRLGGVDPGIDYSWNVYPHTRTFMVGAKINF